MELLYYNLGGYGFGCNAFSPMRRKRDVIANMFKMIKQSNWCTFEEDEPEGADFFAYDRSLGRAYIRVRDTVHSFSFPFSLCVDSGCHRASVSWRNQLIVDSETAALVVSVMSFASDPLYNLSDSLLEIACELFSSSNVDISGVACMLSDLVDLDDGYFRYDYDIEHANGAMHPANHLDVYHGDRVALKVGLDGPLSLKEMRRFIDKNEAAFYLRDSSSRVVASSFLS